MTTDDLNSLDELMDVKLNKLEERLNDKLTNNIRGEIKASEKRIIKGIVSFVSDHLLPIVDEKADKEEVEKIRKKVNEIESLPTVVHELKIKRN